MKFLGAERYSDIFLDRIAASLIDRMVKDMIKNASKKNAETFKNLASIEAEHALKEEVIWESLSGALPPDQDRKINIITARAMIRARGKRAQNINAYVNEIVPGAEADDPRQTRVVKNNRAIHGETRKEEWERLQKQYGICTKAEGFTEEDNIAAKVIKEAHGKKVELFQRLASVAVKLDELEDEEEELYYLIDSIKDTDDFTKGEYLTIIMLLEHRGKNATEVKEWIDAEFLGEKDTPKNSSP